MARTIRTGTGEYRVPAKAIQFILPAPAKEFLLTVCESLGKTQQQFMGEAVDIHLKAHGMPALGVRSMRDEQEQ